MVEGEDSATERGSDSPVKVGIHVLLTNECALAGGGTCLLNGNTLVRLKMMLLVGTCPILLVAEEASFGDG